MFDLTEIAKFDIFAGLAFEDLEGLLARSRTIRIMKKGEIFAQGAEARSFFVLVDGFVRATKTTGEGYEVTVRYVSPGEIFGAAAAIGIDHYPAAAAAVTDATILRWPSSQWSILAERHPVLATNALRTVGSRLQDAHSRVIELTNEEVECRMARTLLRLADRVGRKVDEGIEIEIPLRRQDVAQLAGTTLHSASRVLSSFGNDRRGNSLVDKTWDHLLKQQLFWHSDNSLPIPAGGENPSYLPDIFACPHITRTCS